MVYQAGVERSDSDDIRLHALIRFLTLLGIGVHILLLPLFYWLGLSELAAFNVFSVLAWIYARRINSRGFHTAASTIIILEVSLHSTLAVYFLGWQSGFQYYLIAGIPFLMFNNRVSNNWLLIQSLAACILFLLLYSLSSNKIYTLDHSWVVVALNYANIIVSFSALIVNSFYFRKASFFSESQLEAIANIDALTGLLNRSGIHELLNTQYSQYSRNGIQFCLMFGDVDHIKMLNENYGFGCGDKVISSIAGLLKHRLRQSDTVARWEDEKFLMVLPNTEVDSAIVVAEHIRTAIEELSIFCGKNEVSVTMTFGIAKHNQGNTIYDTIDSAEKMLKIGKETGRNSVISAR